jgi:ABC-type antimicrobial peptide transport system permease subunit
MRVGLIGIGAGLLGALAMSRVMTSLVYGVLVHDGPTFIGVAMVLTTVAFVACYIPAHRAAKVDPMVALRHE